ncbi:D-glycero-beta-D-manno-heptose-7-phosphate kinase [Vitreoscilla stercoraria]|uniref:D-glycero-beta-D-manno-heptose-7-phosphate kinase n=2 Tax=Neisseriaceae TaxID=481 RepID=A0ABY4EEM1_VITST|nr:D-glycero-beta-D-manno-heptose-7-phosphate kinase [Vitreoscilla stercoraria]
MAADDLSQRFAAAKILVVGDVMLDRYWFGDTHRISPEAPVPVAKIEKIDQRAGGAANVARNIACLGGQASLLAITGDDEPADALAQLMQDEGVQSHLVRDSGIATTIKLRVVARNQQLIRLDFEDEPQTAALQQKWQQYRDLIQDCDVVVLSDYGKGGLAQVRDMILAAKELGKPVLVDPKGNDYMKYESASLITPNRSELKEVVGAWHSEDELIEKAQRLRDKLHLDGLLLTRSEEGMTLFKESHTENQDTRAQEVFDVSGAGDTVIASMALCVAAGLSHSQAMHVANTAAGVVVAKLGTAVCTQKELFDA